MGGALGNRSDAVKNDKKTENKGKRDLKAPNKQDNIQISRI